MSSTINLVFSFQDNVLELFQLAPTSVDIVLNKVPSTAILANNPKDFWDEIQKVILLSYRVSVTAACFLAPKITAYNSNPDGTTCLKGTTTIPISDNEVEKLYNTIVIFFACVKVYMLWQVISATLFKNCFQYIHYTTNCNQKVKYYVCIREYSTNNYRCMDINCIGYKTFRCNCCPLGRSWSHALATANHTSAPIRSA